MAKKKVAPRPKKEERGLEASHGFHRPPKPAAVEPSPPDLPDKLIPVLRKKPIVIEPDPSIKGSSPAVPPLRQSPIAAALRKRAAENASQRPKRVDAEVHLPATSAEPADIQALRAPPPAPPEAPVEPQMELRPPRPMRARGLGPIGFYGSLLLLVAVAGVVVNASLPWLIVPTDGPHDASPAPHLAPGTLGRSDLATERAVNPYFDRLVGWPMLCYTFLMLVGLLLAGIDELPRVSIAAHRNAQVLLLGLSAFLGFIVTLSGTRWLGLYVNALLDAGPPTLHLHVAPYLNLLGGAAIFGASTRFLLQRWSHLRLEHARGYFAIEDVEAPKNFILAAALLLLTLPLLPFASLPGDEGRLFLGEADLAAARDDPHSPLGGEVASYGSARAMAWLTLYLSIVALGVGLLHRGTGQSGFLGSFVSTLGILGLPILVGAVSSLAFLVQLMAGSTTPSINLLPLLGFGGLGLLYVQYVQLILRPYVARVARTRPA